MSLDLPRIILFHHGRPDDWLHAAEVLDRASPSLVLADSTRACKSESGFVSTPLPAQEAEDVARALTAAGYPASALSVEDVVNPPPPYLVSNADAYEDGFHIQVDFRGDMRLLPWNSIHAIGIYLINMNYSETSNYTAPPRVRDENRAVPIRPLAFGDIRDNPLYNAVAAFAGTMLFGGSVVEAGMNAAGSLIWDEAVGTGGLSYGGGVSGVVPLSGPPKKQVKKDPVICLELFVTDPYLRLRIRQKGFNYDYLEDRKKASSPLNFELLVQDILQYAPHVEQWGSLAEPVKSVPETRYVRKPSPYRPKKALEERELALMVTAKMTRDQMKVG